MGRTISTRLAVEGESEFKGALKSCNQELAVLKSEMVKVDSEFKNNQNSMEALTTKGDMLTKTYEAQQGKVGTLRDALANAESAQKGYADKVADCNEKISDAQSRLDELKNSTSDTTEEEKQLTEEIARMNGELQQAQAGYDAAKTGVNDWQKQLNYAEADLNTLGNGIESNNKLIDEAKNSSDGCATSIDKFGQMTSAAGGPVGDLGGKITNFLCDPLSAAIGIAAAAALALVELAKEADQANQVIVMATGASGEALESMAESARSAYAVLDETDFTVVASVVGELNTRLDLQGDALTKATALIGDYADATGTDAAGAVATVSKVMKNWNVEIEGMEGLLDKLTKAAQISGISVDSLSEMLVTNKAQFQQMGFSLDESIALLANFEKEGINTSQMMTGFRKAINHFADEGKNASAGLAELVEEIKNAGTESEANNIAVGVFGDRSGQEFALAVRTGRFEIDGMTEAIANSGGIMRETAANADTFEDKVANFGNQVKSYFMGMGADISKWWGNVTGATVGEVSKSTKELERINTVYRDGVDDREKYVDLTQAQAKATAELEGNQTAYANAQKRSNEIADELPGLIERVSEGTGINADMLRNMGEQQAAIFLASNEYYANDIAQIFALNEEYAGCSESMGLYGDAIALNKDALSGMNAELATITERSPDVVAAVEAETAAQEMAQEKYSATVTSIEEVKVRLEDLGAAYQAAYDAAYASIDSQVGLFKTMSAEADQSVGDLIGSLDSQIAYMDTYAENIKKAMELGVDEGLIAKLSDGSEQSAKTLAAIVQGGADSVKELNEKLGMVEEGKGNFARTVADMQTGFSAEMDLIEKEMTGMVTELNQYSATRNSANDTVQGFIDGATARYDDVYTAYEGVANAANRAVKESLKIASPAKVMIENGSDAVGGFIVGSEQRKEDVRRAYYDVAQTSISTVQDAIQTAEYIPRNVRSGNTGMQNAARFKTIPQVQLLGQEANTAREIILKVDERILGRVAIDEINRITRQTGDIPLEMY